MGAGGGRQRACSDGRGERVGSIGVRFVLSAKRAESIYCVQSRPMID